MSALTTRQRAVLRERIAHALCWREVPAVYRTDALNRADRVLDVIDGGYSDAMAMRRAVKVVVERAAEMAETA